MEAGNWKSYQDYCRRSSFFKMEEQRDEEIAYIERKQEEFLDAAVDKFGLEIEDKAEDFISDYEDMNDDIDIILMVFEEKLEEIA